MRNEERAASMKLEEIVALLDSHQELQKDLAELQQQIAWFKQQLFGVRSERYLPNPDVRQLFLGELAEAAGTVTTPASVEVPAHRRRVASGDSAKGTESDIRFDPSVPVMTIEIPSGIASEDLDQYVWVGEKVTTRLAQQPGSYVVLREVRQVWQRKDDRTLSCPPAPESVLEKSCADVSFLAGLLIDKLTYHLPLYRQHQRLAAAGVHLARSTLTHLFHRASDLLVPIYDAQLASVLESEVLAMDETPIKAGRRKNGKGQGQMKVGYFWPIYGDRDEVVFPFATTRSARVVEETLRQYAGVLLSDGYEAYDRHAARVEGLIRAQCWNHARRKFFDAEPMEPELASRALLYIEALYAEEDKLRKAGAAPEKVLAHRGEHSKPVVDQFFAWLATALDDHALLPSSPFTKAAHYALEREKELRVFLAYPDVPLDTNHLERTIRLIAMGRKNWLFCWTEVGAKYVGVVQSLLITCRLHGVDPYTYLVDVLQRVASHPAKDVAQLTPRLWKECFGANPLRSRLSEAR